MLTFRWVSLCPTKLAFANCGLIPPLWLDSRRCATPHIADKASVTPDTTITVFQFFILFSPSLQRYPSLFLRNQNIPGWLIFSGNVPYFIIFHFFRCETVFNITLPCF